MTENLFLRERLKSDLSRRQFLKTSALLGAGSSLLVHGRGARAATSTVRFGMIGAPDSLNPFATFASFEPTVLVYDMLVGVDAQRHADRKGLAESWSHSADGLTWTFKLWPNLKWSDGQPATAKDVAFTYNYLRNSMGTPHELTSGWNNTTGFDVVAEFKAVDEQTFQIQTKKPTTWPIDNTVMIVPEHVWKNVDYSAAGSTYPNSPPLVGTGPVFVSEWNKAQKYFVLEPNRYFRTGAPHYESAVLQDFSTSDPMVAGLKGGSLDYVSPLTAAQWANLKGQSPIVVGQAKIEQTDVLAFNTLNDAGKGSTPALQDPKFRDAVGYAIDQNAIVKRAFQGHADPGVGPIPPIAAAYYSDLPDVRRKFDLEKAGQLLDAAGYKLGGAARTDKQGNDIRLQLVYGTLSGTNQIPAAVVELIVAWLGQIGIPVTATRLDSAALYSKLNLPSRGGGGFDLIVASRWFSPDAVSLLQIGVTPTTTANNLSYWSNKDYDDMVDQVSVTLDSSARKALVDKAARLLYTEAPFIFLDYPYQLDAHRTDHFVGWGDPDAFSTWGYVPFDRLKPA